MGLRLNSLDAAASWVSIFPTSRVVGFQDRRPYESNTGCPGD
jgi:hypothetical protein